MMAKATDPMIIACPPFYFFTVKLSCSPVGLIWGQNPHLVSDGVFELPGLDCFAVKLRRRFFVKPYAPEDVLEVLQSIWSQLHHYKVTSSPLMPTVYAGDPRVMRLQSHDLTRFQRTMTGQTTDLESAVTKSVNNSVQTAERTAFHSAESM